MSKPQPQDEREIIYIPDEDGNEEEFEVFMTFEVDNSKYAGNKYMMLIPVEGDDEDMDEVYAFRFEEEGDDLKLYTIDDEEEWNIVTDTFETIQSELGDED